MATVATQIPMAASKTHVGGVELAFEVVEQPPFPQSQHDSHPCACVYCKPRMGAIPPRRDAPVSPQIARAGPVRRSFASRCCGS